MWCISKLFPIALMATTVAIVPLFAQAQDTPGGPETPLASPISSRLYLPQLNLRVFLGLFPGVEAEYTVADRLRARVGQRLGVGFHHWLTDVAMYIRLLGSVDNALWVRAGYQHQRVYTDCLDRPEDMNDRAHAVDAGVAYRYRSKGGHLVEAELGREFLFRAKSIGCNDSGVDASSFGLRASVYGQYTLSPGLGVFARAGVRTAHHILEIHFLPEAEIGVAFRF